MLINFWDFFKDQSNIKTQHLYAEQKQCCCFIFIKIFVKLINWLSSVYFYIIAFCLADLQIHLYFHFKFRLSVRVSSFNKIALLIFLLWECFERFLHEIFMTNRLHHFIKVMKISVIYLVNYTTYIVNSQKTHKKAT